MGADGTVSRRHMELKKNMNQAQVEQVQEKARILERTLEKRKRRRAGEGSKKYAVADADDDADGGHD